jgi:hypothetical protein
MQAQTFTITIKWLSVTAKGAKLGHVVGVPTQHSVSYYESYEALAFLHGVGSKHSVPTYGRYEVVAI